jgi:septation ring formation regulator EzrA
MLPMAIITVAMIIITIIVVVVVVVVVSMKVTRMTYQLVTKLSIFSMNLMPIGFQTEIKVFNK